MNLNILTYCIYLPIISFITIKVGWTFYKHGEVFLFNLIHNNTIVKNINNLLLLGYYLVNIGYAIITISYWDHITSTLEIINTLSTTLGKLILLLGLLHYNNIFWLNYLIKNNILKQ